MGDVINIFPGGKSQSHDNAIALEEAASDIIRRARDSGATGIVFALTLDGRPIDECVAGELETNIPLAQACALRILYRLSAS